MLDRDSTLLRVDVQAASRIFKYRHSEGEEGREGQVSHSEGVEGRVSHSEGVEGRVSHSEGEEGREGQVSHSEGVEGRVSHSEVRRGRREGVGSVHIRQVGACLVFHYNLYVECLCVHAC